MVNVLPIRFSSPFKHGRMENTAGTVPNRQKLLLNLSKKTEMRNLRVPNPGINGQQRVWYQQQLQNLPKRQLSYTCSISIIVVTLCPYTKYVANFISDLYLCFKLLFAPAIDDDKRWTIAKSNSSTAPLQTSIVKKRFAWSKEPLIAEIQNF